MTRRLNSRKEQRARRQQLFNSLMVTSGDWGSFGRLSQEHVRARSSDRTSARARGRRKLLARFPYAIVFVEQDPGKDRTIRRRSGPRDLDAEGAGMTWAPAWLPLDCARASGDRRAGRGIVGLFVGLVIALGRSLRPFRSTR